MRSITKKFKMETEQENSILNEKNETENIETIADTPEERENYVIEERENFFYPEMTAENLFFEGKDFQKQKEFINLEYSYGYDCSEKSNLLVFENNLLCFFAGNVTILYNVETKEQKYIWSHCGGGVGAIDVHPSKKYLAVAEKGKNPTINIYSVPQIQLYKVLKEGAEKEYSCIEYSPDGLLLASVAGSPDFTITIWNWEKEQTILRSKAFSQDVYFVNWSKDQPGHLVTGGLGHIKFWKMAKSFTGLKLQGLIGMFGKTEISSITGCSELPDGKVLAGNEFGNVTMWEGGHIKTEIVLSNNKKCHGDQIRQFILEEDEITTVSFDGTIKVWDFDTIDSAEPFDESLTFQSKPINELKVGNDIKLMKIVKNVHSDEFSSYYAQDSAGGILKLDLSFSNISKPPKKIYEAHTGAVNGIAICPTKPIFVTTGDDGYIRFYHYIKREILCSKKFNSQGLSLIWAPDSIDPNRMSVIAGFADGIIRIVTCHIESDDSYQLSLTAVHKPHSDKVVALSIDSKSKILATGSEDKTVFFFEIGETLTPYGFINLNSEVVVMKWKDKANKILIGCREGFVCECELFEELKPRENILSYHLEKFEIKKYNFKSVKSRILHDQDLAQRKKKWEEEKVENIEKMEKQLEKNEITGDEFTEYKNSQFVDDVEWKEYIPPIPNSVVNIEYENDYFVIMMNGYDAGYYYYCRFSDKNGKTEPFRVVPILNFEELECQFCLNHGEYNFFGMSNGAIRLENASNRETGAEDWCYINMHDSTSGCITCLAVSYDWSRLISAGRDGNIFCYNLNLQEKVKEIEETEISPKTKILGVDDFDDNLVTYSIEDTLMKVKEEKRLKQANERKFKIKDKIMILRKNFRNLVEQNKKIPQIFRLRNEELIIDDILEDLYSARFDEKKLELLRTTEYETVKINILMEKIKKRFKDGVECERIVVTSFNQKHQISTYKLIKMDESLPDVKVQLQQFLEELTLQKSKTINLDSFHSNVIGPEESFDDVRIGATSKTPIVPLKGSKGERIDKALKKVELKKKLRSDRKAQWKEFYETKPGDNYEDADYAVEIQRALENMGNYKLKSADDYVVPEHMRLNSEKARLRLIQYEETLYKHKTRYNDLIFKIRDKKVIKSKEIVQIIKRLKVIQNHLSPHQIRDIPEIIKINFPVESKMSSKSSETTNLTSLESQLENFLMFEEQEKLIEEMIDITTFFDAEVYRMKREKCFLDIEMKKAELRQITLFEELIILKDFQKGEEALSLRISAKEDENIALKKKIAELQIRLDIERKEIERNVERESQLLASLKSLIEDGNKFTNYLQKLFRKRIKKKNKSDEDEDSDLESNDDSDSEDELLDSEDETNVKHERYDYEICPPSLDPTLYSDVYELRKRRTEIDDKLNEGKKAADQLSKEIENLQKKLKTVESAEQAINRELEAYQLMKQKTLNELKTTVVLSGKQICHLVNGRIPENLSNSLIFEKSELRNLENRIKELESEKVHEAKRFKNAKKFARQLMTNKKKTEGQLQILKEECKRMMIDKFGTLVNIEMLENVAANRQLEEVRQRFEDVQNNVFSKIQKFDELIREEKKDALKHIKENTEIKLCLVESLQEKKFYGDKLESKQKKLGQEFRKKMQSEIDEAKKMKNYILAQNQEIHQLQTEIKALSRKDGVVFPPINSSQPTISGLNNKY